MQKPKKKIDFYDDKYWPKLVSLLTLYIAKANEHKANGIDIDLTDIAESVLGIRASRSLSEEEFEGLTQQRLLQIRDEQRTIDESRAALRDIISDSLTLNDFIEAHGEWVMAEVESPRYVLIHYESLKVVTM